MGSKTGAITFAASLYRSVQDGRDGEVTLTLKVPASDSILVTQAFQLLREMELRVTLALAQEGRHGQ